MLLSKRGGLTAAIKRPEFCTDVTISGLGLGLGLGPGLGPCLGLALGVGAGLGPGLGVGAALQLGLT